MTSASALDHVGQCGSYEGWKNYLKMTADQDVLDISEKTELGTVYYLQSRSNKSWTIIEQKESDGKACVVGQGLNKKSLEAFVRFRKV